MANDIYDSMIQHRGAAYRSDQIKAHSHYREPIDTSPGRLAGNSRVWGDASPEVQSRVIDTLIDASRRAGLNPRETAYVLATARVESGFNPDAAAGTTSAAGLGQMINNTGSHYGLNNGNRFDARAGADALVAHFIDNRNLAQRRGQGEEYIYKYHHDGPSRDYGGLGLSRSQVMPYVDRYEQFVRERLGQERTEPGRTQTPTQLQPARTQGQTQGAQTGSFQDAMNTMLPPQNGVRAHVTGRFGEGRSARPGVHAHSHAGTDFNYVGGQSGINLRHPEVHSPVSGTVEIVKGSQFNTVGIRDAQGNLHQFLHLDAQRVRNGQHVNAGDVIGTMGNKGPVGTHYPQHVHYQIKDAQGRAVDPERFWNGRTIEAPDGTRTQGAGGGNAGARTSAQPQSGTAVLANGARGPEVESVQRQLAQLGYNGRDGKPLQPDGRLGDDTAFALSAYQRAHGLGVDGKVGEQTRSALAASCEHPLMSEATHPAHGLYAAFAERLPDARPAALANLTMQSVENGITSRATLGSIDVNGDNVFVRGTNPVNRFAVDLQAPTASVQQISDHVADHARRVAQSNPAQPQPQTFSV